MSTSSPSPSPSRYRVATRTTGSTPSFHTHTWTQVSSLDFPDLRVCLLLMSCRLSQFWFNRPSSLPLLFSFWLCPRGVHPFRDGCREAMVSKFHQVELAISRRSAYASTSSVYQLIILCNVSIICCTRLHRGDWMHTSHQCFPTGLISTWPQRRRLKGMPTSASFQR
jgi:hypothetical protein